VTSRIPPKEFAHVVFETVLYVRSLVLLRAAGDRARSRAARHANAEAREQHKHLLAGVGEWEELSRTSTIHAAKPAPVPARETVTAVGEFWVLYAVPQRVRRHALSRSGHYGYDAREEEVHRHVGRQHVELLLAEEGEMDAKTKALVMRWQAPAWTAR
jgi:hypothetical protein